MIRFVETTVDISELHRQFLVKVAFIAVVVDSWLGSGDRLLDGGDRLEWFVLDFHGERGLVCLVLGECCHR